MVFLNIAEPASTHLHLITLVLTDLKLHLNAFTFTCIHSPSQVSIRQYALIFTCAHSSSLVCSNLHMYALIFTCAHSPSLRFTHLHLYVTHVHVCALTFTRSSLVRTHIRAIKRYKFLYNTMVQTGHIHQASLVTEISACSYLVKSLMSSCEMTYLFITIYRVFTKESEEKKP